MSLYAHPVDAFGCPGAAAPTEPVLHVVPDGEAAATVLVPAAKHRPLWIPKCVATGVGPAKDGPRLTGQQVLVYLALLDACDHKSREHTIDTARIAARTRSTPRRVRDVVRGPLAASGLVAVLRSGSGTQIRVRVAVGTPRDHLALPVAAVWPTKDVLRWTKDAGPAIRTLLALLAVLDHPSVNAGRRTSTTWPVERIAEPARLKHSHYRLGLAALVGPGPRTGVARTEGDLIRRPSDGAWLTVEARTAAHRKGRVGKDGEVMRVQDTCEVSIDWSALPMQMVPARAENDENAEAENDENAEAENDENAEAENDENAEGITPGTPALQVLLPSGTSSLQADSDRPTTLCSSSDEGGREGEVDDLCEAKAQAKALMTAAITGRTSDVEALIRGIDPCAMDDPWADESQWETKDRADLTANEWLAVVIAALVDQGGLRLTATDVRDLSDRLLLRRAAGWDALEVAQRLTADVCPPAVRSPVGLLVTRIGKHLAGSVEVTHGLSATALAIPAQRGAGSTRPVDQPRTAADYAVDVF